MPGDAPDESPAPVPLPIIIPPRRGRSSTPPPPSSIVACGVQDCQLWAAEIAWRERATSAAAGRLSVAA
eukprot:gene3838-6423_t